MVVLQPGMLLTLIEVATWLAVRPRTVQRWVNEGGFPVPMRYRGQVRWRSEDLIAWSVEEVMKERIEMRMRVVSTTPPGVPTTNDTQAENTPSEKRRRG